MEQLVQSLPMILILGVMVVFFIFTSRKSKKEQQQIDDMRNNLQIGDEVTTIGGIIGRVVSVKDETVLIETGRDKVKIRFLRTAIRSVDVKAEDAE
ncbi:MAG: preprotein translocase subunit YajC [Clostridia bacterium]|nr:preprotein translocase subunit YajC [Clostridia bacterium]